MPTPAVIIQNTPVACYLAYNAIEKYGMRRKGFADPLLAIKIRVVYRFVKRIYDLDPDHEGMVAICNYMWELCGAFGVMALGVTGTTTDGGQITPITPVAPFSFEYLIPITAADFTTATDYSDSRIAGKELQVFWKNVPNFQSSWGWRLIYTPGGFTVFVDDGAGGNSFDAFGANSDAEFDIYIVHPVATVSTTASPVTPFAVPLQGDGVNTYVSDASLVDKSVIMVFRGTPYGILTSGSPAPFVCVFTSSAGRIDFDNIVLADEFVWALAV